jgi:hypothetical protein
MGLFEDMRRAGEITADVTAFEPAQRIDTLVVDPDTGEQRRRTDYAGTAWYGGRPQLVGRYPLPGQPAAHISEPFWLADSLAYAPGAVEGAQIQATAAVQGGLATDSGGNLEILDVVAALGEHPEAGGALLLYVAVTAVASLPFGVSYRVTVVCAPELVQPRRTP